MSNRVKEWLMPWISNKAKDSENKTKSWLERWIAEKSNNDQQYSLYYNSPHVP